jgi:hypothetical protein
MGSGFGRLEFDATCPITLDLLGELYRADPITVNARLSGFSEDQRARVALFCYSRAHLRDLALTIAAGCDAARLGELAGTLGQVLAGQCRAKVRDFGGASMPFASRPKARISLGGARA